METGWRKIGYDLSGRLKSLTAFYFLLVVTLSIAAGLVLRTSRSGISRYNKITTKSVHISGILLEIRKEADDVQSSTVRMIFNRDEEDMQGEAERIDEIEKHVLKTWAECKDWLVNSKKKGLYDSLAKYKLQFDAVRKELLDQSKGSDDNLKAVEFYYNYQITAYNNYQQCIQNVSNQVNQVIQAELAKANSKVTEGSTITTGWLLVGFLIMVVGGVFVRRDHRKLISAQRELAIEKQQKMIEITRQTLQAQERERDEIGKELHDNVNQLLGLAVLNLSVISTNPEKLDDMLPKSIKFIQHAVSEIRGLSKSLINPLTKNMSLHKSINELISSVQSASEHMTIQATIDEKPDGKLDNQLKLTVYRIIQEQINNILKHAQASFVAIRLEYSADLLKLHIQDNGVGFDLNTFKTGIGLTNIRNRAEAYNGQANFDSAPGMGCTLEVIFPLKTKNNPLALFQHVAASFF